MYIVFFFRLGSREFEHGIENARSWSVSLSVSPNYIYSSAKLRSRAEKCVYSGFRMIPSIPLRKSARFFFTSLSLLINEVGIGRYDIMAFM